jgi:hypothetical protein
VVASADENGFGYWLGVDANKAPTLWQVSMFVWGGPPSVQVEKYMSLAGVFSAEELLAAPAAVAVNAGHTIYIVAGGQFVRVNMSDATVENSTKVGGF